eukprot:TRINITY_DN7427_c0_g1_i1.p1 TRINITY_DN7427_c0_g1~~TRINITY_DN7427_c0_g1_i1.p1  ORF type:complete len:159 (-),score=8.55 TRINITY_DN7427_c0_g1_i1:449-925(-)
MKQIMTLLLLLTIVIGSNAHLANIPPWQLGFHTRVRRLTINFNSQNHYFNNVIVEGKHKEATFIIRFTTAPPYVPDWFEKNIRSVLPDISVDSLGSTLELGVNTRALSRENYCRLSKSPTGKDAMYLSITSLATRAQLIVMRFEEPDSEIPLAWQKDL